MRLNIQLFSVTKEEYENQDETRIDISDSGGSSYQHGKQFEGYQYDLVSSLYLMLIATR